MTDPLARPLALPCGAVLPNRIAKAAMSEHLAGRGQDPSRGLERLYARWAAGGAGLLLTGNVMVDRVHVESRRNVVVDARTDAARLATWAEACAATPTWVQLNHPGRQTPRHVVATPVAPSALPPVDLLRRARAFGPSRALSDGEIEGIVEAFGRAAAAVRDAGFAGVQVHAAHGYLASQFLAPRTNHRTDRWGGDLEGRARFLRSVVAAVRAAVGPAFPVGVKLNAADFQRGGLDEPEARTVLLWLEADGVDLVEVSGGTYEQQAMFDAGAASPREAYFLAFAAEARRTLRMPLMVTGGFRTAAVMRAAVQDDGVDVVGLARPFTEDPDVARHLLDGTVDVARAPDPVPGLGRLGGVSEAMMSVVQMGLLARGKPPSLRFGRWHAVALAMAAELASLV